MAGQSILTRQKESNMKDIELSRTKEELEFIKSMSNNDKKVLEVLFNYMEHIQISVISDACGLKDSQVYCTLRKLERSDVADLDIKKEKKESSRGAIANAYLLLKMNMNAKYTRPRDVHIHITPEGNELSGISAIADYYDIEGAAISYQLKKNNFNFEKAIKEAIKLSNVDESRKTGPKSGESLKEKIQMKFVKKSRCPKPEFNVLTMGI